MRTLPRVLLRGMLLTSLALLFPARVSAQTGAASLTGIVTDRSGAAVPGAILTATNQATNVGYNAVANDAGNYTITYFEFRAEAFNLTNTPSSSPPARDINAPNTFGTITSTASTARTVELVVKFYF